MAEELLESVLIIKRTPHSLCKTAVGASRRLREDIRLPCLFYAYSGDTRAWTKPYKAIAH